jgi:seryl-tRNA synthetase
MAECVTEDGFLAWQTESEDALRTKVEAIEREVERLRARIDSLEGKRDRIDGKRGTPVSAAEQLPPKALARKLVDAAVAEAEAEDDEDDREFIYCKIGKAGGLEVVVTYNDFDGAEVEIWGDHSDDVPEFSLSPDDVSAIAQAMQTATFAIEMIEERQKEPADA